jgi:hypothetical protein
LTKDRAPPARELIELLALDKISEDWLNSLQMKIFPLLSLARKVGVVALGLWLAGAGCLLGCEGMVTAEAAQALNRSTSSQHGSSIVAEGDACSSSEAHSCCKKKVQKTRIRSIGHHDSQPVTNRAKDSKVGAAHTSTENRLAELPAGGMKACPFAVSRALAVAKVHDGQINATAAVSYTTSGAIVREQTLSLSTLSPLPNRGHTYLRCCAFLI